MIGRDGLDTRNPSIQRSRSKLARQVHLTRVAAPDGFHLHFTCRPDPDAGGDLGSQLRSLYRGIFGCLDAEGARPVNAVLEKLFFRDVEAGVDALSALRTSREFPWEEYAPASIPLEEPPSVDGEHCWAQIAVFVPGPARPARWWSFGASREPRNGHRPPETAVGKALAIDGRQHLWIGNILGKTGGNFLAEALSMFEGGADLLASQGVSFTSVVRTWIYLREMERDYGELNRARRAFFLANCVKRHPASTGIGGAPAGKAHQTALCLYAITGPAAIEKMHTATLNEASDYGSDFARGMSVEEGGRRTLYISGTASVDEEGRTVWLGDFERQVERMLLNIEKLLENQGATFDDLASAITYLKDPKEAETYRAILARRGLLDIPHSIVKAEVCRPELLCEMEAIGVIPPREK